MRRNVPAQARLLGGRPLSKFPAGYETRVSASPAPQSAAKKTCHACKLELGSGPVKTAVHAQEQTSKSYPSHSATSSWVLGYSHSKVPLNAVCAAASVHSSGHQSCSCRPANCLHVLHSRKGRLPSRMCCCCIFCPPRAPCQSFHRVSSTSIAARSFDESHG